jgi:hypothetical protein
MTDVNVNSIQEDDIAEPADFKFDTEFNVDEEFKPTPLIPSGRYEGNVTKVHFDPASFALVWEVTLCTEDDMLMSDGETPVNGNVVFYRNWLPKAGDESTRTKTGKMTKRQAKINMLREFSKNMKISMNTPQEIMDGVNNCEWIGISVMVTVEIREWEGRFSNNVKDITAI